MARGAIFSIIIVSSMTLGANFRGIIIIPGRTLLDKYSDYHGSNGSGRETHDISIVLQSC